MRMSSTRRILGAIRGRQSRRSLVAPVLAAMIFSLLSPYGAVAVNNTGVFELEGNAVTDHVGTGAPDDWDRVCHQVLAADCSTSNNTNGATAVEFASQTASGGTTFTGGGSKDPIDVSSWAWNQASGGLPGKDVLLNGFAARYSLPATAPSGTCPSTTSTCSVIFFGMDRFDNAGDAQNGFWFFQNKISLATGKSGGGQTFNGVHKNGDLLVVSDFSIGGTISTIGVYLWNSVCTGAGKPNPSCADSNLQLLQTSSAANCATSAQNAAFCGIVDQIDGTTGTTMSPWPFTDKKGNTSFDQGEFYEGGINLSLFPGLAAECFASTLAESRSSTSTSAVLKSFVLGNFGTCTSGVRTTPQDASGNNISNGSISIGTGSVNVQDQAVLTVGGASSFGGSVTFHLCGPADLVTQSTCATGGSLVGSAKSVSPPSPATVTSDLATITSAGSYCWRGDYSGDPANGVPASSDSSSTECFTVTPVTPTLTTRASGPVALANPISDTATLTGTANQPGSPVINPTTPGAKAGGTITFTAYGPNDCSTLAFTSAPVNVNGDGTYGPVSFTPTAVGTYTFVASYSGNSPNTNGAGPSACPDSTGTETVLVTDTTGVTTAQNWLPNDSATITSTGGSPLSGSVTFTLYDNGTCNGNVLYAEPAQSISGTSPQTAITHNTGVKVSASTTVSWQAVYTSTAANIGGSSSNCETTSLTINN
jgi:hypothetical protein